MINAIGDKTKCCGCSVCASVCPKKCISIVEDEEGFYYPIVDKTQCINCGLCERKCPVLNVDKEKSFEQSGYLLQIKKEKILRESTSGGAFSGIAEWILSKGGYVVGAAFDVNLKVCHIIVDNESGLSKFRNSKYVQSEINPELYNDIKNLLDNDKWVCFSGTACQIEAVKRYLGKEYKKLLCVDVICRAVPSPLVLKKYIEYQEYRTKDSVEYIRFRDKYFGYQFTTVNLQTKNKLSYHHGIESDPWLRCFFSNICNRPICHECVFKKRYRVSDITIWDGFGYETVAKDFKKNAGAGNILIHTDKGKFIFDHIKCNFNYFAVDVETQVKKATEMTKSIEANPMRTVFFEDVNKMNGVSLFNKYFPLTLKCKTIYLIRLFLVKIGIYRKMKRFFR